MVKMVSGMVGAFDLPQNWVENLSPVEGRLSPLHIGNRVASLPLLAQEDVHTLVAYLQGQSWIPVGIDGMKGNYAPGDPIGSWRASCFNEGLADVFVQRIKPFVPEHWFFNGYTTENHPHRFWKFLGVNPLMRFIRYDRGGVLVPHYDWSYRYPDGEKRTLVSLVVYLSGSPGTGRTRFLRDPQSAVLVADRDMRDWSRFPVEDEILHVHEGSPGSGLLFDHALLHDGEEHFGNTPKIILRTDLVFAPMEGM